MGSSAVTEATARRVAQTVAAVKKALVDLSETRSPEQISISLLCKTAGISRPTFYEHFDGVFEVYDEIVKDRLAEIEAALIEPLTEETPDEVATRARLITVLEYIDLHRAEIGGLIDSPTTVRQAGRIVHPWSEHNLAMFFFGAPMELVTPEQADRIRFISSGVIGILVGRITDTGTPLPAADTAERIIRYAKVLRELD